MSNASPVQILVGASPGDALADVLQRLTRLPAWRPYDERVLVFVGRLSQRLLTSPRTRAFPELVALAHWFRLARVRKLARDHHEITQGRVQIGRGLAFHLAPSNVDSVFMYSWLISLLAGNTNLVRVSQKGGAQQDLLLDTLRELTAVPEFGTVSERFVVLTYPHDDQITQSISASCLVRVVWGGDTTVRAIRTVPLHPMAVELCFADRFSAAAISASAVLAAKPEELLALVKGFYNDTFWFAQQACSSPRLVAWIGNAASVAAARARFWPALSKEVRIREAENAPAMVMARLGASFEYAALGVAHLGNSSTLADFPLTLDATTLHMENIRDVHCGNGLFVQIQLEALEQLASQLSPKEQTLAVFGFEASDLHALLGNLPPRALDRITHIGNALDFDMTWDGQDLLTSFTRIISLPTKVYPSKEPRE